MNATRCPHKARPLGGSPEGAVFFLGLQKGGEDKPKLKLRFLWGLYDIIWSLVFSGVREV